MYMYYQDNNSLHMSFDRFLYELDKLPSIDYHTSAIYMPTCTWLQPHLLPVVTCWFPGTFRLRHNILYLSDLFKIFGYFLVSLKYLTETAKARGFKLLCTLVCHVTFQHWDDKWFFGHCYVTSLDFENKQQYLEYSARYRHSTMEE